MFLHLLPEIQEEVLSYCSFADLRNLSCCSRAYNEALRDVLWYAVRIPSTDLLERDVSTELRIEHLQYTEILHIHAVYSHGVTYGGVQVDPVFNTNINTVFDNCRVVFQHCHPKVLETWYLPTDVITLYGKYDKLVELRLSKYAANDATLVEVCNTLTRLTTLSFNVGGNNVSDAGIIDIGNLINLEKLLISGCGLMSDQGLSYISMVTTLKELSLRWCRFTDAGMNHLRTLLHLEKLEVTHSNTISDESLCHICTLESLKELNLTGCYKISSHNGVGVLFLEQQQQPRTTTMGVGVLFLENLINLEILCLTDCREISDGFMSGIGRLANLKELDLTRCHGITNEGLNCLVNLSKLKKLNITGCDFITEEVNLPQITTIIRGDNIR